MSASGFVTLTLADIAEFCNGKGLSPSFYSPYGKYPVFGSNGQIARTNELLNPFPVIVIGRVGAFCGSVYRVDEPSWTTDNAIVVKPQPHIDFGFLYYRLKSLDINRTAIGSAQPLVTQGGLKIIQTLVPSLPEQKAIAHILGILDDKIELNQQMNRNLEAIAQAIFKSWFVDFDPVRAKMEGRQPAGMDAATAALFPDSFEDSALGEIPKGWGVKTLGEVLELAYGKALKENNRRPGDIPVYGSNGQIGWHDEKLVDSPGIVVGRKGNPGTVIWCPTAFFPIDTTFYVVPKDSIQSKYYLLYALRFQDLPSLSADSAVPGLNRNLAYMNHILVPPSKCLSLFDSYVQGVYEKIQANNEQSRTLATIRDTLLPKLMSGEIRVKEAKEILEDVA